MEAIRSRSTAEVSTGASWVPPEASCRARWNVETKVEMFETKGDPHMTDDARHRDEGAFPHARETASASASSDGLAADSPTDSAAHASTNEADDQAEVTRRYDRMARFYDVYDAPMEWLGNRRRRRRLISQVEGDVLEVGVGTGKNLPFYPPGQQLTGIDVSERMLNRARDRADRLGISVSLGVADVTRLPFDNDRFDTTVATSVFCSVGDPIAGLAELGRVTKPEGSILLLEHVRPRNPLLGWLADLATALTRRLFGFRANRRTEENVAAAGLRIVRVRPEGVWREIVASPDPVSQGHDATASRTDR